MMGRFVTVLALTVLAISSASAQSKEQLAKGRAVFDAQKCALCHSIEGKGQAKGPLDDVGAKFKADEIREWLVDPVKMAKAHNATRKPVMKAYPNLPKDDLDALVAYLSSLKKK